MYPILGICGRAGSGKDTAADFMVSYGQAKKLALADPMKRLAASVYEFTDNQLWGPSNARNAADQRYMGFGCYKPLNEASDRMYALGLSWVESLMPGASPLRLDDAFWQLKTWCTALAHRQIQSPDTAFTCRHVLQQLGTQWGRNFSQNLWVDYCLRTAESLLVNGGAYDRRQGLIPASLGDTRAALIVVTDVRFANEVLAIKKAGGLVLKILTPEQVGLSGEGGRHASETEQDGIPEAWFDARILNDKKYGLDTLEGQIQDYMDKLGF